MRGKPQTPKELDPSATQGGLVPDRLAVPDASKEVVRDISAKPHVDTNTVEGLADPDAEAKAPGRTTHGATNNP